MAYNQTVWLQEMTCLPRIAVHCRGFWEGLTEAQTAGPYPLLHMNRKCIPKHIQCTGKERSAFGGGGKRWEYCYLILINYHIKNIVNTGWHPKILARMEVLLHAQERVGVCIDFGSCFFLRQPPDGHQKENQSNSKCHLGGC